MNKGRDCHNRQKILYEKRLKTHAARAHGASASLGPPPARAGSVSTIRKYVAGPRG